MAESRLKIASLTAWLHLLVIDFSLIEFKFEMVIHHIVSCYLNSDFLNTADELVVTIAGSSIEHCKVSPSQERRLKVCTIYIG